MRVSRTPAAVDRGSLVERFRRVRATTLRLSDPLSAEDMVVQVKPHASPVKWHLAHTTWFFETFVLVAHRSGYRVYDDRFCVLFNSYYNAVGEQHPRPQRGALTRPESAKSWRIVIRSMSGQSRWRANATTPRSRRSLR